MHKSIYHGKQRILNASEMSKTKNSKLLVQRIFHVIQYSQAVFLSTSLAAFFLMLSQTRRIGERLPAAHANVRPLPRVNPLVPPQIEPLGERLIAVPARERSMSNVDYPLVPTKTRTLRERFTAGSTRVGFPLGVGFLMSA